MADNYLERQMEEYEARKQAWLKGQKNSRKIKIQKPEDESL